MLYLGIDLHKDQITVNLRNEQGDVIEKGQVRTDHDALDDYFAQLAKRARKARGFMAIFEICGFCDWLIEKLQKINCKEIVVIQPDYASQQKTDRRDANALGELLWNNRKRLVDGRRPNGIRRIFPADPKDAQVRQLAKHYEGDKRIYRLASIHGISTMRRLATIVWHILRWDKTYQFRYEPPTMAKKGGSRLSPGKVLGGMGNNHHKEKKVKTPLPGKAKTRA